MTPMKKWGYAATACLLASGMAGCGTPGAPQPPSLNLPDRVTDLAATRAGNQVTLTWTMPKRNTDRLVMKDQVTVRACRQLAAGVCQDAGIRLMLAPGADGSVSDMLTPALASGSPRALSYFIELKNRNGRSAGLSNAAVVLAGEAPAEVMDLSASVVKNGVVLHWRADSEDAAIRLQRTLLTPPPAKAKEGLLTAPAEPIEQNLLVEDGRQGGAIDKTVHSGETYAYRAQRVARVTVDGKTLELAGAQSAPARVEVRDIFPPAVPAGLAAVATLGSNGMETAIDLSWQPDTEPDLAGYIVYRREGGEPWQQISSAAPVAGPSFHDPHVTPGHTYHYAVSAVDQSGHESARSTEASETVPAS